MMKLQLIQNNAFIHMKSFLNYFASKMILLNILQIITIYFMLLFRTLQLSLEMIDFYTTGQIKFPFHEILFWCQSK